MQQNLAFVAHAAMKAPLVLCCSLRSPLEGRLTAAQLKRELRRIAYGQGRLAQKLGVNPSEVRHWLAGDAPVPAMVALDIRNLPSHDAPPPPPSPRRRA